jgi:hypothetical protein
MHGGSRRRAHRMTFCIPKANPGIGLTSALGEAIARSRWLPLKDTKCSPSGYVTFSELAAIETLVADADKSGMKSSMTELPPNNTRRWVARRKAAVVAAVSSGTLTVEEACRRYQMSEEELSAWQRAFETYGIAGLRVGYVQEHRSAHPQAPQTKK